MENNIKYIFSQKAICQRPGISGHLYVCEMSCSVKVVRTKTNTNSCTSSRAFICSPVPDKLWGLETFLPPHSGIKHKCRLEQRLEATQNRSGLNLSSEPGADPGIQGSESPPLGDPSRLWTFFFQTPHIPVSSPRPVLLFLWPPTPPLQETTCLDSKDCVTRSSPLRHYLPVSCPLQAVPGSFIQQDLMLRSVRNRNLLIFPLVLLRLCEHMGIQFWPRSVNPTCDPTPGLDDTTKVKPGSLNLEEGSVRGSSTGPGARIRSWM